MGLEQEVVVVHVEAAAASANAFGTSFGMDAQKNSELEALARGLAASAPTSA